jgi:hypothetical protein
MGKINRGCELMENIGILPKTGTKLITHTKLGSTDGMFIAQKNLDQRRPNEKCIYIGYVPGHGGDVWWCEHSDGKIAAYSFAEVEFDVDI